MLRLHVVVVCSSGTRPATAEGPVIPALVFTGRPASWGRSEVRNDPLSIPKRATLRCPASSRDASRWRRFETGRGRSRPGSLFHVHRAYKEYAAMCRRSKARGMEARKGQDRASGLGSRQPDPMVVLAPARGAPTMRCRNRRDCIEVPGNSCELPGLLSQRTIAIGLLGLAALLVLVGLEPRDDLCLSGSGLQRDRLQQNIEPVAVTMWKHRPDVEP